jgi:hypothetical protein
MLGKVLLLAVLAGAPVKAPAQHPGPKCIEDVCEPSVTPKDDPPCDFECPVPKPAAPTPDAADQATKADWIIAGSSFGAFVVAVIALIFQIKK